MKIVKFTPDSAQNDTPILHLEHNAARVLVPQETMHIVEASPPAIIEVPESQPEPQEAPAATTTVNPTSVTKPIFFFEVLLSFGEFIFKAVIFFIRTTVGYLVSYPMHAIVNFFLLSILALVMLTGAELNSQLILDKISDTTIDSIISGSRFTHSFGADDVERNGVREFLRVGAPIWTQRESVRAILFEARKAGLSLEDQAVLLAIADIESGFNPFARAPTTSACGIFQFVKHTGEAFSLSPSECMDPWQNANAGVQSYLYNYQRKVLKEVAGLSGAERVFRTFELMYYLHHDGPESSNSSVEVKAIVLNGSQFLFKAYRALTEESQSQKRAPGFLEKFSKNLWKVLDTVTDYFRSTQDRFSTVSELFTGSRAS